MDCPLLPKLSDNVTSTNATASRIGASPGIS